MKTVLLTLTLGAAAFTQTAPTLARLYTYQAAPGAQADLFDLQRDTVAIYKANKSPITRLVWTSLAGKPSLYLFVPIPNLAELNEPTWLSKQGTDLERTGRQMRLARAMDSSEMQVLASVSDLTWDETPNGPPDPFAVVSITRVKPGRVQAFINSRKEVDAAMRKVSKAKSIYSHRTAYGGNAYDFHTVVGYESLADITTSGPQELRKALGDAKYAAYLKANSENIESVERHLVRYRPEFSYAPEK